MRATGHGEPWYWNNAEYNEPQQPVIGVTWEDAQAYCEWAGARLPTEEEWEYAASGGQQLLFPTSTGELSHDVANYEGVWGRDRWEKTSPVGSFPANPFGLFDMAGNAWEWCSGWYDRYPGSTHSNRNYGRKYRIFRGGSFSQVPRDHRVANRFCRAPTDRSHFHGIRCAKTPTLGKALSE